jgi:CRP-like cAMP-binding protein
MTPTTLTKNTRDLDPKIILAAIGMGRKVVTFLKEQTIFTQGDAAGAVFYIQEGKVRHTVVSKFGMEATLGILREGEFFGVGCLAGQPLRMGSATAMTDCKLVQIDKDAMTLALQSVGAETNVVWHLLESFHLNHGLSHSPNLSLVRMKICLSLFIRIPRSDKTSDKTWVSPAIKVPPRTVDDLIRGVLPSS